MRVGKKPNVVEAKKTRSCVVRLEKVTKKSPNVSPAPEESRSSINRLTRLSVNTSTTMAPTPKLRRGVAVATATPQQQKPQSGPIKKRIVGSSNSIQTPQTQKTTNSNMTNIRSNQKIKIIPRSNKSTPVSTPSRDETPPPTIAAGRSRRAIKPNPKYASEDLVTPKVVRNVASLGSSTSRGGSVAPSGGSKTRKASSSSDDFYNRNSEDDYDERHDMDQDDDDDDDVDDDEADMVNDKAYQVDEKDNQDDSDFSDIEEQPVRVVRPRGRPKRVQEPATQTNNKLPTQTAANSQNKRVTSSTAATSTSLRSQPSQLQQIRRSLVTANNQRNLNILAGSGATAQKRKLEEIQDDSSDNESSYTIKRKQLLLSTAAGNKVKVPVKESRVSATSTPFNKSRLALQKSTTPAHSQQQQHQQTVNGSSNKFSNNQTSNQRRAIEITAKSNAQQRQNVSSATNEQQQQKSQTNQTNLTTQAKLLAAKTNRQRSGSPKLPTQKARQNGAALTISSNSTGSSSSTTANSKISDKAKSQQQTNIKTKTTTSPTAAAANSSINSENTIDLKDDSPNSTMDDFETMPTFTIVNVNDIINKKGDVLITKAKANNNKAPTVIEFSESISLDDEEDEDDDDEEDDVMELATPPPKKLPTHNNNKKTSSLARSSESLRKLPTKSSSTTQPAPQILNHKLGLRNTRVTAKTTTTLTATLKSPDKPAPRILNSMVAKKTQPVKPLIANMEDSADESFPLSLDEDEEEEEEQEQQQEQEETEDEIESRFGKQRQKLTQRTRKREQILRDMDTEDTESQNTEEDESVLQTSNSSNKANYKNNSSTAALTSKQTALTQRKKRMNAVSHTPIVVSSNKKRLTPAAAKENSLAATNQQVNETTPALPNPKQAIVPTLPARNKTNNEKVVISKQGDKIIKKITCFETWYVINMPPEIKRSTIIKNQLEMPLIRLANNAKNICLPNDLWSTKVTLYELSPQTLGKGTYATFTGDLFEHNIKEEDRGKYQPSCVMFRRSIEKSQASRMPYDRAVIFKNKTFYTNIEGKNVRLVGAPSIVNTEREIEILLQVVDTLTLQSDFVEHISIVQ
ncbi:hypothetical protein FF38_10941 [Lucilia cuprina]|uniref:Uncharacterized protein n=1 Tax=Lucilia cuprina TaxID=7375 RepID=A0A0L0C3R6_LUCCU|nr:hypothetical protein CVS40_9577 [Lucilia cuprina]KNC26892.1 hypothetical protein FF38_10941 [Lucilia cuprina]